MICGILIKQKHDIVTIEDEIDVSHSLLYFSYKLFARKHVLDIVLPDFTNFDESYLIASDNGPKASPKYAHVRSHLLNILMQKSKALLEIIAKTTTQKVLLADLFRWWNQKAVTVSTSHIVV